MTADLIAPAPTGIEVAGVQRRTLRLLFGTQIIGGIGTTIGITVGALLAARLGGIGISGLAASSAVVGGALLAVPVTRLMHARGRRPGLAVAYLAGAAGAVLVVIAAVTRWVPLLLLGMLLFGGGSAANLQARYTAVDLATPARRGRQLSIILWATTIGAVAAPNFAALADQVVDGFGLPPLSGPFAFSAVAFGLAAALLVVLLRPDPLLTARRIAATSAAAPVRRSDGGVLAALRTVAQLPAARLGIAAVAMGHLVMVGVMSMTPVHIGQVHVAGAGGGLAGAAVAGAVSADADVLRVVGIVLSLHIAGMYALSPLVGVLTDRLGPRPVILGGIALLLAACAVAGTAGDDMVRLAIGLALLGLGWSGTMVAGSTLLAAAVPIEVRASAQGLSDLVMGLAGASAGALSGLIVEIFSYATLNLLAAVAAVPLVALALRPGQAGRVPAVSAEGG